MMVGLVQLATSSYALMIAMAMDYVQKVNACARMIGKA
jgi:hypothetical protein